MKISERIKHLQKSIKTHKWIDVYDNRTEYSPLDVGFFLEDADEYLKDNPDGVMDRELDTENHCTKDGVKCISLGFGNKDCGGRK